jgi:hypothetical protein
MASRVDKGIHEYIANARLYFNGAIDKMKASRPLIRVLVINDNHCVGAECGPDTNQ